ncbi:hypothetical protein BQ8482_111597 [Mesorhizobium delmotii]|uniref:Uncharacterized protein n=1 Tax=Mesorhizobium delmotii TaxID=1631247 RepID=A0A2P9AEY1_9HYPH|nr:hypothetical protein BQ8482_111597 [Mesorhizobium delmotii]
MTVCVILAAVAVTCRDFVPFRARLTSVFLTFIGGIVLSIRVMKVPSGLPPSAIPSLSIPFA